MPVTWRSDGPDGRARLELAGVVGVMDAVELHGIACELAGRGVDVDAVCDGLEHLDSSAAQILLALSRALREGGQRLMLIALPDEVLRYLSLAGLAEHLTDPIRAAATEESR